MAKPRNHKTQHAKAREISAEVLKADTRGEAEQEAFDRWLLDLTEEDMRQLGRNMKAYMEGKPFPVK